MGASGSKKKAKSKGQKEEPEVGRQSIVFEDSEAATTPNGKASEANGSAATTTKAGKKTKPSKEDKQTKEKSEPKPATAPSSDKADSSSTSSPPKEEKAPKSVAGRLQVKGNLDTSQLKSRLDEQKPRGTKMFAAKDESENRSNIYKALNPQKLFYESRREKEMAKEESEAIHVGTSRYEFMRDEEGNIIEEFDEEEEEEEEEEDYDPDNLPDFGEYQAEMEALRAERAKKAEERRQKLREEYERKKAEEEAARQAELKKIAEKEAALAAQKEEMADDFVEKAQSRLDEEVTGHLQFKFSAD